MMLSNRKTAGIRVPDNKICTEIVTMLKNPVISTTASDENETPFETFAEMSDYYEKLVDIIIDGGNVPNGPSSVISLINDEPEILRKGIGSFEEFE
jgi:tRNA threonylcarbamoyl adenosine modification protein (Sua5/YciO/YrdC/YwlC family)